jgi:hypothetical protein
LLKLHPQLLRDRAWIVEWHGSDLDAPDSPEANPLVMADSHLYHAVESLMVELPEIGGRYLLRAKQAVERAFADGIRPYRGAHPILCLPANDDPTLNHHRAIGHRLRYTIDTLLGDPQQNDLQMGLQHLAALVENTSNLQGEIKISKIDILCAYLWLGIAARDVSTALKTAASHMGTPVTPGTIVRSYRPKRSYLRMLYAGASFAGGDPAYRQAASGSLANLLLWHRDLGGKAAEVCWRGPAYGYEWAWLWECCFTAKPSAQHAIEILRGTAPLDPDDD